MGKSFRQFLVAGIGACVMATAIAATPLVREFAKKSGKRSATEQVKPLKQKPKGFFSPQFSTKPYAGFAINDGKERTADRQSAKVSAIIPVLCGSVQYNTTFTLSDWYYGLYRIENGESRMLINYNSFEGNGGGIRIDNHYFATTCQYFWDEYITDIVAYDLSTGEEEAVFLSMDPQYASVGFASDPTTGTIYGITYNEDATGYQLSTLNFELDGKNLNVTHAKIAALPGSWNSLVCDNSGQLYGITIEAIPTGDDFTVTSSTLCKIDKRTGAIETVGVTGQLPYYASSATIDASTNKMYWNVAPASGESSICEVDLATGRATELCKLVNKDRICGMYVNDTSTDKAPASVSDLNVDFPTGSLTGTILFTAPTKTFDGVDAQGELTYEIRANNEISATGTTEYGESVACDVTLPTAGQYLISVTVSNGDMRSQPATIEKFIGFGIPSTPLVNLSYLNGTMKVSWKAVDSTVDGGYIDPEYVTYTVTRFPGNEKVADHLTETTFSEPMDQPMGLTSYYYTVTADNGGSISAPGESNKITIGSIVPPYTNDFFHPVNLDGYSILDENRDNVSWIYQDHSVRCGYGSKAMDDWIVAPAFYLEKGKSYQVSMKVWGYDARYPERVEVMYGKNAIPSALTGTVIGPTEIKARVDNPSSISGTIVPEETGVYYIGIHGISDADNFYLCIDDFAVESGVSTSVPAEVENLVVTPDYNGELKAEIKFNAPTKDATGAPLNSIKRIDVKCGEREVKTFENPTPGEALSCTDEVVADGYATYIITATNENGISRGSEVKVYIGVGVPPAVSNITVTETSKDGEVTVAWDKITADQNGNPLNPDLVNYYVASEQNLIWVPVTEKTTANSVTFQAVPDGKQEYVRFAVFAQTRAGESVILSPGLAVGTPYESLEESFADTRAKFVWSSEDENNAEWAVTSDGYFSEISSVDGDDGYTSMEAFEAGGNAVFTSGKIAIVSGTTPNIYLSAYNVFGASKELDRNRIEILVREAGSKNWQSIFASDICELGDKQPGWQTFGVSLADFAGKTIQVGIKATAVTYWFTHVDNIRIGNFYDYDMAALSLMAPEAAAAGTEYMVSGTVKNNGSKTASNIVVTLKVDGAMAASKEIASLGAGLTQNVDFKLTMHPLTEESVTHQISVTCDNDGDTANNNSETVSVMLHDSKLPAVNDLQAQRTDKGVILLWSEPDQSGTPGIATTEGFENGRAFAKEFGDWSFVDVDKSPVGSFQQSPIPGISGGTTLCSFLVFDSSYHTYADNETLSAYAGNKYLASLFRADDGVADDWAISPELDGYPQIVSFMAKSYDASYPEKIEFYYSTESKNPSDFVKIGEAIDPVPNNWTSYSYLIPEGAKYFAVRSCAKASFMLMLDDFNFASKKSAKDNSILGYDVYRDGVQITESSVKGLSHPDNNPVNDDHEYRVVSVYKSGLSAPSNIARIKEGSVEGVSADDVTVHGVQGAILINGAAGNTVAIYTADGKKARTMVGSNSMTIHAQSGVYVVTIDSVSYKVLVK